MYGSARRSVVSPPTHSSWIDDVSANGVAPSSGQTKRAASSSCTSILPRAAYSSSLPVGDSTRAHTAGARVAAPRAPALSSASICCTLRNSLVTSGDSTWDSTSVSPGARGGSEETERSRRTPPRGLRWGPSAPLLLPSLAPASSPSSFSSSSSTFIAIVRFWPELLPAPPPARPAVPGLGFGRWMGASSSSSLSSSSTRVRWTRAAGCAFPVILPPVIFPPPLPLANVVVVLGVGPAPWALTLALAAFISALTFALAFSSFTRAASSASLTFFFIFTCIALVRSSLIRATAAAAAAATAAADTTAFCFFTL
mmetsp:Transcript_13993/g.33871  ORF Transcript_13993/g.33871 Transcript_13993/m.33871 type:complete len:312 (-) Transcript_13993:39-974(-)